MANAEAPELIMPKRGVPWTETYRRQQDAVIESLHLDGTEKQLLHYRWLGAVDRIEEAANRYRVRHNLLRLFAIVGGVIVSGIVGISADQNPFGVGQATGTALRLVAFVLSLGVTAAVAVDEYFRYGDRYRESRLVAETLRIEGSRFEALTGPYRGGETHKAAFAPFMSRVEAILERDAKAWVAFAAEAQTPEPPAKEGHRAPE